MKGRKTITQRFQVRLAVIIAIAMTVSTLVLFLLGTKVNEKNYTDYIASTLGDVEKDIEDASDFNMLSETRRIRERVLPFLETLPPEDTYGINQALRILIAKEELSELSIVNTENIVIYSTVDEYLGFDMSANPDSNAFGALNNGATEIVQPVRANAYRGEGNYTKFNKYAGVPLEGIGYLQIAISSQQFQKQIDENVRYIAANRRIGQTGHVIIANGDDRIISYAGLDDDAFENHSLAEIGLSFDRNRDLQKSFECRVNGVSHLAMAKFVEGYYIIGIVPMNEVQAFRDRAAIQNTATALVIFVLMFIFIRHMINTVIVSKIHNINHSLTQIMQGMLETKVNEYSTREFATLSDDINSTVTSLQDYMSREQQKIKQELEFAKNIQLGALPKIEPLENYGDLFELYATMSTAKEVGGDFYDFYLLDESHLAILIADVSGKGVPAAMFMMICKTMLKNLVESGLELSEAFTKANDELCAGNDANMFVTVWMGILDLETGDLEYVNAGHNPPLIYNAQGCFEYLRSRAGFVLSGMEGMRFKVQRTKLRRGDKLYLYTDGVTEANDPDENLYGEDRLLTYLNSVRNGSMKDILLGVKADIDRFARNAEQFDDITMLGLCYRGRD